MTNKVAKANCTNVKWVGRAHCDQCHVRQAMMFSGLPESAFEDSLHPINHYIYPDGASLYEAETLADSIYSIRRGMVKLVHVAENGCNRIVRLIGPGSSIGLELLDHTDTYRYNAIAVGEVDLCKIPLVTIKSMEEKYPILSKHIRIQLQDQLNLADQWIVDLATGTAKQRVAQLLIILSESFSDKDGVFTLLSREDMAAIVSIAFENVSRVIAEFKRNNILSKVNGNAYTCDTDPLYEIIKNS